jgi:ABC-type polysaccharide/polyol phosphate export permease
MNKKMYFNVCKNLIASDLIVFKQIFFNRFIDLSIWVVLSLFVIAHVMPSFGLSASFGVFQFGGMLAAIGLFEVYSNAVEIVADLEGDHTIDYTLTLPIPSWLAIASKAGYYAIIYFIFSISMLPIGKLSLWNQLDLSSVNYFQLALVFIFQSIFCACFTIWAGSVICNMSQLGTVWSRFIFPMWFMGGFQFSWTTLYGVAPIVAWINLINPMIYITESMRVAMLGQPGYLNFWLCLGAIAFFSVLSFMVGLWNLKKRLDFVW